MKVSHFQEIIQVLLLKRKPWKDAQETAHCGQSEGKGLEK